MMDEKVKEIMQVYREQTENIKQALRAAEVPEALIALNTMNLPNLENMLPQDVLKLFVEFRRIVVIYLYRLGFSQREIVRRIGAGSLMVVNSILKEAQVPPKSV